MAMSSPLWLPYMASIIASMAISIAMIMAIYGHYKCNVWPLVFASMALIIAIISAIYGHYYCHYGPDDCHLWPWVVPLWLPYMASIIASMAISIAMIMAMYGHL